MKWSGGAKSILWNSENSFSALNDGRICQISHSLMSIKLNRIYLQFVVVSSWLYMHTHENSLIFISQHETSIAFNKLWQHFLLLFYSIGGSINETHRVESIHSVGGSAHFFFFISIPSPQPPFPYCCLWCVAFISEEHNKEKKLIDILLKEIASLSSKRVVVVDCKSAKQHFSISHSIPH